MKRDLNPCSVENQIKRNRKLKKALYVEAVILLMALCFWKTASFLDIEPPKAFSFNDENSEKKNELSELKGIDKNNFFQHYDGMREFGFFANDKNNVYYVQKQGERWNLVRNDNKLSSESLLCSGGRIKNLMIDEDNIFFVSTAADSDKILKDYICSIPIQGGNKETFYQTEADMITSMMQDNENLYFTNSASNSIFQMDKQKKEITELCSLGSKSEPPVILNIESGKVYYVDGTGIYSISLGNKEKTSITEKYSSIEQNPLLNSGYLYLYDNLSKRNIIRMNLETKEEEKVVSEKELNGMHNFSIYGKYIFVLSDDGIYYKTISKEDKLKLLKEAKPQSEVFFMANDFLYYEDAVHGKLNAVPITYLTV